MVLAKIKAWINPPIEKIGFWKNRRADYVHIYVEKIENNRALVRNTINYGGGYIFAKKCYFIDLNKLERDYVFQK